MKQERKKKGPNQEFEKKAQLILIKDEKERVIKTQGTRKLINPLCLLSNPQLSFFDGHGNKNND